MEAAVQGYAEKYIKVVHVPRSELTTANITEMRDAVATQMHLMGHGGRSTLSITELARSTNTPKCIGLMIITYYYDFNMVIQCYTTNT